MNISLSACKGITTTGLAGVANCAISFFNIAISLLMALTIVYIVWGAFQMLQSEEKRQAGKDVVMYGIIGLFIMVSVWGIVNILNATFGLAGQSPMSAPTLIKGNSVSSLTDNGII